MDTRRILAILAFVLAIFALIPAGAGYPVLAVAVLLLAVIAFMSIPPTA